MGSAEWLAVAALVLVLVSAVLQVRVHVLLSKSDREAKEAARLLSEAIELQRKAAGRHA